MAYEFELRHLRAFLAVADEGHFGRAAQRLHVAQPALSRTIQQLERGLGCRLVDRTTRSVSLTAAGHELADRAREVLTGADEAARAVGDIAAGRAGRLRIGYTGPAMIGAVPERLRRFHQAHPSWRYDVHQLSTTEQLARLLDRTLDLGFFLAEMPVPGGIETAVVSRARACVGLPVDHRLAGREGLSLDELAGERLVLFPRERNPVLYDEVLGRVSGRGTREVEVVEASSRQVAAGLVAAGLGVSTFTEDMRGMCGPGVVLVPQVDPERTTTVLMGWRRDTGTPLVDALGP